jgi:hypothetical protein
VLLLGVMSNRSGCIKYIHKHQLVISCRQQVLTAVFVTVLFSFSIKISIILTHYEDTMSVCSSEDFFLALQLSAGYDLLVHKVS